MYQLWSGFTLRNTGKFYIQTVGLLWLAANFNTCTQL